MKILQLNRKRQKRLLALCKEFFPEYQPSLQHPGDYSEDMEFVLLYNGKSTSSQEPHWYMLCLTELPKRIWNKIDWEGYNIGSGDWFEPDRKCYKFESFLYGKLGEPDEDFDLFITVNLLSKHPVDFLWDFVQECKKNKYFKK